MNTLSIRRAFALTALAGALAVNLGTAQASQAASTVSALSGLPIALSVAAPVVILSAGASLIVTSVSVTVAGTTATSAANFTIGTGAAPTLSSFSPSVAGYGATVTLTGTNYDTTLINNRVAFTAAIGAVATATTTSITVPVPGSAQTGPISVSTTQGKATSAQEFFVAPPGVVATDIQYTGRITVNGPTVTPSIPMPSTNGLLVFDGVAGQRLSIGLSSPTITQFYVSVYRPDGGALTTPVLYNINGGSLDLPVLPMAGTYTIFLDPYATYTGNVTVTLSTEVTGNITPGGAAVPVTISRVGQNARYVFTGSAGQTVSLNLSSVTVTTGYASLIKPDGSLLAGPTSFGTGGGVIDTQVLPTSGTYAIFVDPAGSYTGSVTLTLYNTADVTGAITVDGSSVTPALTVPGQRARYTFTGTAGQWINLGLSTVSITSSTLSMLNPDGTTLVSTTIGTAGGSLDPTTALPTTGTYTIVVDPASTYTGSMTLTLSSALTGSVTLDGAAVPISLTRIGRTARYTFSGTAGQWVSLGLTSVTLTNVTVTLLAPNGTTLASTSVGTGGGGLEPASTLPTTGTYTIVVDPTGIYTGTITLKLMSYLSGALNLNGTATTSTISTVGQNARYTFTGTAGQWVSVGFTAVTLAYADVTLYKPDGTYLTATSIGPGGYNSLDLTAALPTTGTYTLAVNPSGAYTGATTITLSSEVTGSVTINAAASAITIGRAGQNARYTFAGTASQPVTVKITGNTLGSTTVNLYTPSGGYQTGTTNSAASFNLSTVTLATTGTYTITLNPQMTATGGLNLQVTNP